MDHAKLAMTIQNKPLHVRNVCVCAHIDHGKTTLVDALLASNNLIAKEHIGQLRQMDYLYSEQERCITMKASAVSLLHLSDDPAIQALFRDADGKASGTGKIPLLINIIDTPGHCDFANEVLAAVSVSDGALLLLDTVEGVSSQTLGVLQYLIKMSMDIVLVINKMDRLYTELNMTPTAAYFHLLTLVNDANDAYTKTCIELGLYVKSDGALIEYFSPSKGNVVFASALNNWGFSLGSFASFLVQKYPFIAEMQQDQESLLRTLWGSDTTIDLKNGCFKTMKKLVSSPFATLVLESIWAVLSCIQMEPDGAIKKLSKMYAKCMGRPFDQATVAKATVSSLIKSFLSDWLPLSTVLFNTIVTYVHAPTDSNNVVVKQVRDAVAQSASSGLSGTNTTVILCGKVLNKHDLDHTMKIKPSSNSSPLTAAEVTSNEDSGAFLLCRVLSGPVERGQQIAVISYEGKQKGCRMLVSTEIRQFYCPIIQSIVPYISHLPHEGNICIMETSTHVPFGSLLIDSSTAASVLKAMEETLFLCSQQSVSDAKAKLKALTYLAKHLDGSYYIKPPLPLIHVSIAPTSLKGYTQLLSALDKLCSIDSGVTYKISKVSGEIVLAVSGDVHLDRCCEQLDGFMVDSCDDEQDNIHYLIGDTTLHLKEHVLPGKYALCQFSTEMHEDVQVALADYKSIIMQSSEDRDSTEPDAAGTLRNAFFGDDSDNLDEDIYNFASTRDIPEAKEQTTVDTSTEKEICPSDTQPCDVSLSAAQKEVLDIIFKKIDTHIAMNPADRECTIETLHAVKDVCNRFVPISNQDVLTYYYQLCGKTLVTQSTLGQFYSHLSLSNLGHATGMEFVHIQISSDGDRAMSKVIIRRSTLAFVCGANSYLKQVIVDTIEKTADEQIKPIYVDESSRGDISDYESALFYHSISNELTPGLQSTLIEAFKGLVSAGPICEEPVTNLALIVLDAFVNVQEIPYSDFIKLRPSNTSIFNSHILDNFCVYPVISYISATPLFLNVMKRALSYSNIGIAEPFIRATVKIPANSVMQNIYACFDRMRCIREHIDFRPDGVSKFQLFIPRSNSLLFQIELRGESSGRASLVMHPHGYMLLKEDPRHSDVALDDEELIEWGQQGRYQKITTKGEEKTKKSALNLIYGKYLSLHLRISESLHYSGFNNAKRLVEQVKRDKGLLLLQGMSVEAEKQRTVKRNR